MRIDRLVKETNGASRLLLLAFFSLLLLLVGALCSCQRLTELQSRPPAPALVKTVTPDLKDNGDATLLEESLGQSLAYYSKLGPNVRLEFGEESVTASEMADALTKLRTNLVTHGLCPEFFTYLQESFDFYQTSIPKVLVTGYYQAILKASKIRKAPYVYPLYGVPDDLLKVELKSFFPDRTDLPKRLSARRGPGRTILPYFNREEIDYDHVLAGKKAELAWVADRIGLFFLQVQGSGLLQFPDGETEEIGYADANGFGYRPIGKLLIDDGSLQKENVSMQTIIEYLHQNPQKEKEVLAYNPSYVFFKKAPAGPFGSIGVRVTSLRSIATDRTLFPKGAPVFIRSRHDDDSVAFEGLAFNQDTGGAITGSDHIDLFVGRGPDAEQRAGSMKDHAEVYFLKPRIGK